MSNEKNATTGTDMVLSDRQERLMTLRDNMEPGAKPAAIVPRTFAEAHQMCMALAKAGIVPASFQGKPENMMVVIMSGAEVGLPPMQALRLYHIIEGVPRLGAEGVRAIIISSPSCEYFEFSTSSPTEARWIGKRPGRPEKSVTWTIERAQKAGLANKATWQKSPEDMLNARASMQLGRLIWPEICAGILSREEALDGDFIEADSTERPAFTAPAPQVIRQREVDATVGAAAPNPQTGEAPPRRGPGRPPKDRTADPTKPPASSASSLGETKTSAGPSADTSPTSASSSSSTDVDMWGQKIAVDSPTQPDSDTGSPASTGSESSSTTGPSSGSESAAEPEDDDFGGGKQDARFPDPDPALIKLGEFKQWLLKPKSQAELKRQAGPWHAWVAEGERAGDMRFAKGGEIAAAMSEAYAKRKAELPV